MVYLKDPLPSGQMDILLHVQNYVDPLLPSSAATDGEKIRLSARVWGSIHPLTTSTFVYTILILSFTAFLTVPRILFEAGKLAFDKGLAVYQRPNPVVGQQQGSGGKTVIRQAPEYLDR